MAHPDFLAVFGENAPSERHQCAEVSRSQFRRRVRLLGTRHDVQVRVAMIHCRGIAGVISAVSPSSCADLGARRPRGDASPRGAPLVRTQPVGERRARDCQVAAAAEQRPEHTRRAGALAPPDSACAVPDGRPRGRSASHCSAARTRGRSRRYSWCVTRRVSSCSTWSSTGGGSYDASSGPQTAQVRSNPVHRARVGLAV